MSLAKHPEKSALGEILHRGWLNLKTRSIMMNVRPRHTRYCVLTRDNQLLSTFKFQPSAGDLQSTTVKPLRVYKILGVAPWNGRSFAFLLSAQQQSDKVDHMIEADAPNADNAREWLQALRMVIDGVEGPPAVSAPTFPKVDLDDSSARAPAAPFGNEPSNEADLYVKGASVHRGLLNASGENSCFLNVIIQSFWHLTSMRQFLLHVEIKDDSRTVESNVLRALKSIMTLYDDTSSGTIHSRGLRKGLSVLYGADKNFQEGAMYDAEETLLALLNLMHRQTDSTEIKNTQTTSAMVKSLVRVVSQDTLDATPPSVFDENSIPHLVFSHQIYDRFVCRKCHHSTAWDLFSNLVFTTYAVDVAAAKYDSMENMLRSLALRSDIAPSCDQPGCEGSMNKERAIKRFPMVFAISILWATNSATTQQVYSVISNISRTLDVAKCFEPAGPAARFKHGGIRTTYRLRGFVCYYGQHYVSLFYSTAHKEWLMFDDSHVRAIGSWDAVVAQCMKCRFQVVLMYYEVPDQRKDSSVNVFNMVEPRRRKSSSLSSIQSDLNPQTILENDDFEELDSPRIAKLSSATLAIVQEDRTVSPPPQSPTPATVPTFDTDSDSLFGVAMEPEKPVDSIVDVIGDRDVESAELKRCASSNPQDIVPVSSSIAMAPMMLAMNSLPADDEYDVRFGPDCLMLGMYLEKIDYELCVTDFPRSSNGEPFGAEKCGCIGLFDVVVQANGYPMQHYPVERALTMLKGQRRPLIIRFRRSPKIRQLMDLGFSRDAASKALMETHGDVQTAANRFFDA